LSGWYITGNVQSSNVGQSLGIHQRLEAHSPMAEPFANLMGVVIV
jgi:hypothetical protein